MCIRDSYGAKNIFTFKEALLKRDIDTLLELFPFMFGYKELDRAMSYIEGQLRLQLLVSECRQAGMSVPVSYTHLDVYKRQLLCSKPYVWRTSTGLDC